MSNIPQWFGTQGHCVARCRWHLHTHINSWCVSTIGEWYPDGDTEMQGLGGVASPLDPVMYYETAVFRIRDDGTTEDVPTEAERYATRAEARAGHYRYTVGALRV